MCVCYIIKEPNLKSVHISSGAVGARTPRASDSNCGLKNAQNMSSEKDYAFHLSGNDTDIQPGHGIKIRRLMVKTGSTSHIINELRKFRAFNDSFQELASWHKMQWRSRTLERCKGVPDGQQ